MAVKKVTPKTKRKPKAKPIPKMGWDDGEVRIVKKRQSDQSTDQSKQTGA